MSSNPEDQIAAVTGRRRFRRNSSPYRRRSRYAPSVSRVPEARTSGASMQNLRKSHSIRHVLCRKAFDGCANRPPARLRYSNPPAPTETENDMSLSSVGTLSASKSRTRLG